MLIKTEKSNTIINYLKKKPLINLNIISIINNVPEAEIFVDNIENPNGVLVRNTYFNYIYSEDDKFIDEVCETYFKDGFYGFGAVERSIAEKIKKKFDTQWNNPCGLYYMPEKNLNMKLIKNEARSIDIKDAETIDEYYEYRHPGTLKDIKNDIKNRPSSSIYVKGELVSWVLVHNDNSMGIMYTKEEHRKKGYAVDVAVDLASKIIKDGNIPYVHIVDGNYKSIGLAEKCGFEKCGEVVWFGIIAGIPKELIDINNESYDKYIKSLDSSEIKETFMFSSGYSGMYLFLDNLDEKNDVNSNSLDYIFKEAEDEDMIRKWCDIVIKGNDIPSFKQKTMKEKLYNIVTKEGSSYKLYIGFLDDKPVSSSATLNIDDWATGIHFLSTLTQYNNKNIEFQNLTHTLSKIQEAHKGLAVVQSSPEYVQLFEKIGFKTSHNK